MKLDKPDEPVRARLLKAALDCFLDNDYHRVTTRQIAELAGANVSMIRYYFGNKEGLYEEMIRDNLQPMLLKNIFEEQLGYPMDADFLDRLADFNGQLFAKGLIPDEATQQEEPT